MPTTLTVKTGKGRHLYFKHPGFHIKTRTKIIGTKVDTRGDGGYVAGPGSNHLSGAVYEWDNPLDDIAEAPQWLLDIVGAETIKKPVDDSAAAQQSQALNITNVTPLFMSNSWSESDAHDMLKFISADCGYDEWIEIGMALQAEAFGFHVWDQWSKSAPSRYDAGSMYHHWRSFKPGKGISFGTLVKRAQDMGWGKAPAAYSPVATHLSTPPIPSAMTEPRITADPVTGQKQIITALNYIKFSAIQPSIEVNDFVQNLFGQNQFSVTYGESNCGKTFFMTDMSFHIAMGKQWRDRRVEGGGVIYAALEGAHGLKNRIAAFKLRNEITQDIPFAMVASQIDFLNPDGNIHEFIDLINRAADDLGSVKLVVVDTLARALMGGDENSGQDMGMIVRHADALRYATGAHANFIHHSGKDQARGARGHSSLRAAVDTEIEVMKDPGADFSTVKVVKQREMEIGKDMAFRLEKVSIGVNKHNEEITSCVVEPIEKDITGQHKAREMTASQKFVYDVIVNQLSICGTQRQVYSDGPTVLCITYDNLKFGLEDAGVKSFLETEKSSSEDKVKSFTQTRREQLKRAGKIGFNRHYIWLIEPANE